MYLIISIGIIAGALLGLIGLLVNLSTVIRQQQEKEAKERSQITLDYLSLDLRKAMVITQRPGEKPVKTIILLMPPPGYISPL